MVARCGYATAGGAVLAAADPVDRRGNSGENPAAPKPDIQAVPQENRDPLQGPGPVGQWDAVHGRRDLDDRRRGQPHRHARPMQGSTCRATKENCCASSRPRAPVPAASVSTQTTRRSGSARPTAARSSASDAKTGETIEKHFTPGAGVIYRMTDRHARASRTPTARSVRPAVDRAARRAAEAPGRRLRQRRGPCGKHRRMGSAWDAAAPSPAIPVLRRPAPARTASKRRTASSGSPCRRAG